MFVEKSSHLFERRKRGKPLIRAPTDLFECSLMFVTLESRRRTNTGATERLSFVARAQNDTCIIISFSHFFLPLFFFIPFYPSSLTTPLFLSSPSLHPFTPPPLFSHFLHFAIISHSFRTHLTLLHTGNGSLQ